MIGDDLHSNLSTYTNEFKCRSPAVQRLTDGPERMLNIGIGVCCGDEPQTLRNRTHAEVLQRRPEALMGIDIPRCECAVVDDFFAVIEGDMEDGWDAANVNVPAGVLTGLSNPVDQPLPDLMRLLQ